MKFGHIGVLIAVFAVAGCSPKSPEESAGAGGGEVLQHNFTLSQQEFDALAPETQFMVANKALSTMYRGLPADEFFDLTQGLDNPVIQQTNFIVNTQVALKKELKSEELIEQERLLKGVDDDPATDDINEEVDPLFELNDSQRHQAYMARVQSYPLSHDFFVYWMSYFLANTIMFSPAVEMESTDNKDIGRTLSYLKLSLSSGTDIRATIKGWLNNLSRWRVSRSPENHALEMYELYLGKFNDTEEDQLNTLNGGIACSDRYLGDDGDDYELLFADGHIPQTVKVFGKYISSCGDLYDVVSGHPLLIPRVTEVIVNYFLDGASAEAKTQLIQNIVSTGPEYFEDIFLPIIFSKEFLLNSERPKTFEENALNFLHAMHWTPRSNQGYLDEYMMRYLLDFDRSSLEVGVHNMGWSSMEYKIGRTPFLPMDVLSFASYHKAIRENVLLWDRAFDGNHHPTEERFTEDADNPRQPPYAIHDGAFYKAGTQDLKAELDALNAEEFIDLVFLTALGRRANSEEVAVFLKEAGPDVRDDSNAIIEDYLDYIREDEDGVMQLRRYASGETLYENSADNFAELMLDYISRLPEFYYYKAAN